MGYWTISCQLSGVPITHRAPAVIIPMLRTENELDFEYGLSTSPYSNSGSWWKYRPSFFPIFGKYDDYGGIEDIIEDDNTKILESFYGIDIHTIAKILTCDRKADGYDDVLFGLKKPRTKPDDYVEDENDDDRYVRISGNKAPEQKDYNSYNEFADSYRKWSRDFHEWLYKNPQWGDELYYTDYQARYEQLVKTSVMWVHGTVYDELVKNQPKQYGKIIDDIKNLDDLIKEESGEIALEEYFKDLDIKAYEENYNKINGYKNDTDFIDDDDWTEEDDDNCTKYQEALYKEFIDSLNIKIEVSFKEFVKVLQQKEWGNSRPYGLLGDGLKRECLSNHERLFRDNTNEIADVYVRELVFNGKLKDNIIKHWRFNGYLRYCGKYYDIGGTTTQDGSFEEVKQVLEAGLKAIKQDYD